MKIAIGGDHAGFEYKEVLIEMLKADGHEMKDFGPYNLDSVDYPDFVHQMQLTIMNLKWEFLFAVVLMELPLPPINIKTSGLRFAGIAH